MEVSNLIFHSKQVKFVAIWLVIMMILSLLPFQILGPEVKATTIEWANNHYDYRMKLTLPDSNSTKDLDDFPVLIKLDPAQIDYSKTGPNDLMFYDESQTIELSYEVESWNSKGDSYIWIKIPKINANSNRIWLYYGTETEEDEQPALLPAPEVWDDHYLMVHHMEEESGVLKDSTKNKYHGSTGNTTPEYGAELLVGKALDLNDDDYILFDDLIFDPAQSSLTVEMLVQVDEVNENYDALLRQIDGTGTGYSWFTMSPENDSTIQLSTFIGGDGKKHVNQEVQYGNIYHLALVYDQNSSHYTVYANGVEVDSRQVNMVSNEAQWMFGAFKGFNKYFFDGRVDEIRMSSTARSAEWVNYTYNNMMNPSVTFSETESKNGPLQLQGLTLNPAEPNLISGQSEPVKAVGYYNDGYANLQLDLSNQADWSSSNESVITVESGQVTAVTSGSSTLTASYEGMDGVATVNVASMDGIQFNDNEIDLIFIGSRVDLTVESTYDNGSQQKLTSGVQWSSDNQDVATIHNGTVTALEYGEARVTATTEEFSATALVRVKEVSLDGEFSTGWADLNHPYRKPLTFDNSESNEDLIDYPVLVKLNPSRIDYTKAEPANLRFFEDDNKTPLPYEVESWDGNGDSYVWVKVPKIDAGSKEDNIWIYYGGESIKTQAPSAVWDSNYEMVHHMEETTDHLKDSTSYNNDAVSYGSSTTVYGNTGPSLNFNSSYVRTDLTVDASTSPMTWEMILNGGQRILGQENGSDGREGRQWIIDRGGLRGILMDTIRRYEHNRLYHIALSYDPADGMTNIFIDGKLEGSYKEASGYEGSNGNWILGRLNGTLDEVRYSNSIRSESWVHASYLNTVDGMISFGETEEQADELILSVVSPLMKDYSTHSVTLKGIVSHPSMVTYTLNNESPVVLGENIEAFESGLTGIKAGENILTVTATDADDLQKSDVVTVTFENVQSAPLQSPSDPSPANLSENISQNHELSVEIAETGAEEVVFYENKMVSTVDLGDYNAVSAYKNEIAMELPSSHSPSTDSEVHSDARDKMSVSDDEYFSTHSSNNFPYQRFDIQIEENLEETKYIQVNWEGRSNDQLNMYAWNYQTGAWGMFPTNTKTVGDDMLVSGSFQVKDMIRNQTARILVASTQKDLTMQGKRPSQDEYDFSIVWVSDTQYYSEDYPEIYDSINDWIVETEDKNKVKYVIHTGDLVNRATEDDQWSVASDNMKKLGDAGIPYGVVSGNHDVINNNDYSQYWKYFGEERFKDQPTYGGSLDNNRDHYDLVSSDGLDLLVLYLGWNLDQQTIDWANDILEQYPDRKAIVATHAYLDPEGKYGVDGKQIMEEIVSPNQNVFMTVSGHYHAGIYNIKRINGHVVYETLANYQMGALGGLGYTRMLQFDVDNELMYMNTYSPFTDDYNYFAEEQDSYTLPLNPEGGDLGMDTDYFNVSTFSSEVNETVQVFHGDREASIQWKGLAGNNTYYWSAEARDAYGNNEYTNLLSFTTDHRSIETLSLNEFMPLKVGDTHQTVVQATYDDGSIIEVSSGINYSSSHSEVATIDSNGLIKVLSEGQTLISVSYGDLTANYTLQINADEGTEVPSIVSLRFDNITSMTVGENQQTVVEAVYSNGSNVIFDRGLSYNSSNPEIATIEAGMITSLNVGKTLITAIYGNLQLEYELQVSSIRDNNSIPGGATPLPGANPFPMDEKDSAVQVVSEEVLRNKEDGRVRLTLDKDQSTVELSANADKILGDASLEIEYEDTLLNINSALLLALLEEVDSKDRNDSRINLQIKPIVGTSSHDLLEKVGQIDTSVHVDKVGDIFEFELSVHTKDGETKKLAVFETPIQIIFNVNSVVNKNRVGIYYIADSGELDYIGGAWDDEKQTMTADIYHFSKYAALQYDKEFMDVNRDYWAAEVIKDLSAQHIIKGVSDHQFAPRQHVTRAEFTALLVRALKLTASADPSILLFDDVTNEDWFSETVLIAVEAGIVKGISDTQFAPNKVMTREEMAVMLTKALRIKKIHRTTSEFTVDFSDDSQISEWAREYVNQAIAEGLLIGRDQNRFSPKGLTTRAESAQAIYNLLMKK